MALQYLLIISLSQNTASLVFYCLPLIVKKKKKKKIKNKKIKKIDTSVAKLKLLKTKKLKQNLGRLLFLFKQ